MDPGTLVELTAELLDALAEATDHEPCEGTSCLLCDPVMPGDVYSLLQGIERAIGSYMVRPDAHQTSAGHTVHGILARMRTAPPLEPGRLSGETSVLAPGFDARAAGPLYTYLKGVSMDLTMGSGWPRIET